MLEDPIIDLLSNLVLIPTKKNVLIMYYRYKSKKEELIL